MKNLQLQQWIDEVKGLCTPDAVHICDGTDLEFQQLADQLVQGGTFTRLNEKLKPNCFLARSSPDDVARVESRTFICTATKVAAGPTNNWKDPKEMHEELLGLFKGAMRGRTMYVIPFSMGPIGSSHSMLGVQITDSPYVVCNMRIMTRMGKQALDAIGTQDFIPCLHSVGKPLAPGEKDVPWPCNPPETRIVHFPESKSIWSFGSGYGGNALLGKKCVSLRIASYLARKEGWLAEHMLILGITNPSGKKKYIAAAFPSACGKTNLAMMRSSLPGWKIECVGDDIAWMRFGADGRLHAINPETGFFGVAPGTSMESNPNALLTCRKNSIFTNVALTDEGDVWWEGMTKETPEHLVSWLGEEWTPGSGKLSSHPNSRFTAPTSQCPVIDPSWEDPNGVPISAILFGGRRSSVVPLVYEALDWDHGVFMGSILSSETTAAAVGEVGKLRHDPFAMLPFMGYNMGDYFAHWLSIQEKTASHLLPKIYSVNWFRKSKEGKFLWPGYGENARVLKWIFERADGEDNAIESPIGFVPKESAFEPAPGAGAFEDLFCVDRTEWVGEIEAMRGYLKQFEEHLPKKILEQLERIEKRLKE